MKYLEYGVVKPTTRSVYLQQAPTMRSVYLRCTPTTRSVYLRSLVPRRHPPAPGFEAIYLRCTPTITVKYHNYSKDLRRTLYITSVFRFQRPSWLHSWHVSTIAMQPRSSFRNSGTGTHAHAHTHKAVLKATTKPPANY